MYQNFLKELTLRDNVTTTRFNNLPEELRYEDPICSNNMCLTEPCLLVWIYPNIVCKGKVVTESGIKTMCNYDFATTLS